MDIEDADLEKVLSSCTSIADLKEHLSLSELSDLARAGKLAEWLWDCLMETLAEKFSQDRMERMSEAERLYLLCSEFGYSLTALDSQELAAVTGYQKRLAWRSICLRNDKDGVPVHTQGELAAALGGGARRIYLCDNLFELPASVRDVHYIGRHGAVIDMRDESEVDLDGRGIVLENLIIFLAHPIRVKAGNSKGLRFVNGYAKYLGEYSSEGDLYYLAMPRSSFEDDEAYAERLARAAGLSCGTIFFHEECYDRAAGRFYLYPEWNVAYLKILQRFSQGKRFWFSLGTEDAQKLFLEERKMLLYMDLAPATDDSPISAVSRIYARPQTLGGANLYLEWGQDMGHGQGNLSSGSGGLGYGLGLISR